MTFGLLGTKIRMLQIFNKIGNIIPVTVIQVGPCTITQIKTTETCGYNAIQLGYKNISHKITEPLLGHFQTKNILPFRFLKEFLVKNTENYSIGKIYTVDNFNIGEKITVSGLSIGKGNAGNIKKNNFHRGPMSHGSKHHRLQGSMGAGTSPGRVFPGKKMPGRLGGTKCTIKNLEIIDILPNHNLLLIKGSIPGKFGNLISLKKM